MNRKLLSSTRMALAALAATALTLVAGQSPALAALPSDYKVEVSRWYHGSGPAESNTVEITIRNGWNEKVGDGEFRADPDAYGAPGDALGACDDRADGLGVEIRMDIGSSSGVQQIDRLASTRGHNSPYCTGWVTGNIAENTPVAVKVCLVQGDLEYCTGVYYARA